ncbi:MAG: hypothetical protein AAB923_02845 [Patescibacteria group bacterium]
MKRIALRVLVLAAIFAVIATIYVAPALAAAVYNVIAALSPLWLPVLLAAIGLPLWLNFARSQYLARIPYATIELKPGPETPKTARPMELILYALYHRETITRTAELLGRVRLAWSFEICAENGRIRFFMHLPVGHRAAVEARIRAEYPDLDIDEARDYSREFDFNPFTMRLSMREFTLAKPDPYPLKTYVAYEEGKEKRDIFEELLTEMAGVGEGERLYTSWIVRPHQRERRKIWEPPADTLHEDAEREIGKLVGHSGDFHALSESVQKVVYAIERALQKPSFDCGVRTLYIAERKHFDLERMEGLSRILDRFGSEELNGFKSYDPRERVEWPLSELFAAAPVLDMNHFLNLYRRRAFFAPPYYGRAFVLNTEELATVFHLPHIARASALVVGRERRLTPPENLPVRV